MTKRNVCIDSSYPKDGMRVLITADDGTDMVIHVDSDIFEAFFGVEAKEGIYLEIDIEDITKQKKKEIRELHKKMKKRHSH